MAVDPRTVGARYGGPSPVPYSPSEQPMLPDDVAPPPAQTGPPQDYRTQYEGDPSWNPDGSEIGPMYVSPEGMAWAEEHIKRHGYFVDWGTREYFDPETGEVKGIVPTHVPR